MVSTNQIIRLKKDRSKSAECFIKYMCKVSKVRSYEKTIQKRSDEFVNHCVELYYRQNRKCALSGVEMTFSTDIRCPTQISIDRLDNSRGYEIGNVQLVCFWVNNALADMGHDTLEFFAKKITENLASTQNTM
jgi:hypothetical protein